MYQPSKQVFSLHTKEERDNNNNIEIDYRLC